MSALRLDFTSLPFDSLLDEGYDCLQVYAQQGNWNRYEVLMIEDRPSGMDLMVPKGKVDVSVFCGALKTFHPGRGIVIPEGEQAPELLLYRAGVNAESESLPALEVALHKDYCLLRLLYAASDGYGLRVEGGVNGYDQGWRPSAGLFVTDVSPEGTGVCQVVLPRQLNDELTLDVLRGPRVLRGFALGRVMAEMGYDWSVDDLADISVKVDYSTSSAEVSTDKWKYTFELDMEL